MKYILFSFCLTIIACRKDYSCEKCIVTGFKNATIIFDGEPASDGCGWLIKIDSTTFYPDLLNSSYLQDSLPVKIVFEILPDKFSCGKPPRDYQIIHLISIVK